MKCTRPIVALLAGVLPLQPARALAADPQAAPPARQAQEVPTFGVGTAAVTLDVVVRDKKGRAVRDLKASDFEVYEDGVRQTVDSFRLHGKAVEEAPVAPPPAAPPSAAPAAAVPPVPAAAEAENRPQLIAFVFDRLSVSARNLAYKAALTYLDKGHVEGDLVGVFTIDLALRTILPFTREPGLIRAGLERAASQANTDFTSSRGQARDLIDTITTAERVADSTSGAAPSGPGAGQSGAGIAASAAASALNQAVASFQVGMLRAFEALERDQQGYASTNGLLSVVNGLKELPGRKTVVFFSEGLVIPANVQAQFRAVIHAANRSQVSVYAMDAGGLRAESMNAETRQEMLQAAARRMRQVESGRDDASNGIMTRALERNEDLLRLNPESGLGQLASETGGFLIRDTNDAASAFRRIEEDMRFHYLLAYTPSNENYDGRFRTISVKVVRPGVEVQARKGYYAVRPEASPTPFLGYEAPAIAQLDRSPRPDAFPLKVTGLAFPEPKRPGLVPVLVEVPGSALSYSPDADKQMLHADFSIVVRVKDEAQHVVERLSQRYPLSTTTADLEKARQGSVLFYRETELPPGKYRLEAVAYDAVADRASVRTRTFEVGTADERHVRLSSLVLVNRAEQLGPSEQRNGPLYYGQTLLYPNLGEPFRKATATALPFYFTVLAAKDTPAPDKATVEVWRGGQPIGQVTTDLPKPDPEGRIQHAGGLPLGSFSPGAYELKVSLRDGKGVASSSTPFTVEE